MKIKENISVYICDYCKKRLFVKSAMERHEKNCYGNPENQRACSMCVHLEETTVEYVVGWYSGESERKSKAFRCKKLDKMLYPFKVERKGLVEKYPETFEGQEPMPKECAEASPF